ncbi:hypothetical protein ACKWTF_001483 [Chironomus riparius]
MLASILHIASTQRLPTPRRMNFLLTCRPPSGPDCSLMHHPISSLLSSKAPIFGFQSMSLLTRKSEPEHLLGHSLFTYSASSIDKGLSVMSFGALWKIHKRERMLISDSIHVMHEWNLHQMLLFYFLFGQVIQKPKKIVISTS